VLTANSYTVVLNRKTPQYAPHCKKADIFRFEYWLGNICCDGDDVIVASMMRKVDS
jgi:hypothetical protein